MPTGRFISKTVGTDQPLNTMSWQAQAVYMMAIPHLDRDGLITGHPLLLMAQIAPLRAAELVSIMAELIQEWATAELVVRYDDAGQTVLFFPGFLKHQRLPHYDRETPSEFAPPPGYQRTDQGLIPVEPAAAANASEPSMPSMPSIPDQLPTDSGVTPELVQTESGLTPPLKQQSSKAVKTLRPPHAKSSSSSTPARAQPARAAPAAAPGSPKPPAKPIKPEIFDLLHAYGVAEPALSQLSQNGITPDQVRGWIDYLATQDMARPVGYLVKRLRAGEQPPPLPIDDDDPDSYEALKRRYVPAGWEDLVIT